MISIGTIGPLPARDYLRGLEAVGYSRFGYRKRSPYLLSYMLTMQSDTLAPVVIHWAMRDEWVATITAVDHQSVRAALADCLAWHGTDMATVTVSELQESVTVLVARGQEPAQQYIRLRYPFTPAGLLALRSTAIALAAAVGPTDARRGGPPWVHTAP